MIAYQFQNKRKSKEYNICKVEDFLFIFDLAKLSRILKMYRAVPLEQIGKKIHFRKCVKQFLLFTFIILFYLVLI